MFLKNMEIVIWKV